MDPVNPIAVNPQASNQTPSVPEPIKETPKPETKRGGNMITVVAMALFILLTLSVVAFLYYQNQQLKSLIADYQTTTSPSPQPTSDPTVNWKSYSNDEIGFSFKYPEEWAPQTTVASRLISFDTKSGTPGEFFVAHHKDVDDLPKWLTDNKAGEITETININSNQFSVIKGGLLYVSKEYAIKTKLGYLRIVIEPYPNNTVSDVTINQILSTFKFLDPTSTSKACTMEAKICPDGSSVGRSGPNCEFSACP